MKRLLFFCLVLTAIVLTACGKDLPPSGAQESFSSSSERCNHAEDLPPSGAQESFSSSSERCNHAEDLPPSGAQESFSSSSERCNHAIELLPAVGATCTEDGLTEGQICSKCGEVLKAQEVIPAGHDWNEATCIFPKTCRVCYRTEGERKAHDFIAASYRKPKKCSVCQRSEGEPLDAREGLYDLILQKGSMKDDLCYWDVTDHDQREGASVYLVADTATQKVNIFYTGEGLSVTLYDLAQKKDLYDLELFDGEVRSTCNIWAEQCCFPNIPLLNYRCTNVQLSGLRHTLRTTAYEMISAAGERLKAEGGEIMLDLFGFVCFGADEHKHHITSVPEPEEQYSKEWIEWLTREEFGESRKYPLIYGTGMLHGDDIDTSSMWQIGTVGGESHFNIQLRVNAAELDGYEYIGSEDYPYVWKTYYRDEMIGGEYRCVSGQPWQAELLGEDVLYRFNLMDYGMEPIQVGHTYHIVYFIYDKEGNMLGWFDAFADWKEFSQAQYEKAVALGLIGA